ncbi:hypothetical protein CAPTEDRAFT_195161 [Capitella teleta]|uniref:Uncharacterized protein n=1 Tax=Capitella teleta TaxID=283909 RepID=R7VKP2_CAPTE|nr:hypothetical protein CAPTEDRAFT_195161 [Capitella teleta]|eukprot:ELU16930.1 hypothetical protein CAPTEDRAFT_195161 [Capitella teleta]
MVKTKKLRKKPNKSPRGGHWCSVINCRSSTGSVIDPRNGKPLLYFVCVFCVCIFIFKWSSAMTRTPSFLGEESAMKLIPNELLCYAFNYADNSTVSSLSACLCEFYQPQEISSAREILWKEYEQVISTLTKKTRRSQAPTDAVSAKPFAEDIGVWINHVKNNTSASIMTTFCAVNIRKIPNCPPEEINLFSIVARLGALEKKLEDSEPTVHRVQTRVLDGSLMPDGRIWESTEPATSWVNAESAPSTSSLNNTHKDFTGNSLVNTSLPLRDLAASFEGFLNPALHTALYTDHPRQHILSSFFASVCFDYSAFHCPEHGSEIVTLC